MVFILGSKDLSWLDDAACFDHDWRDFFVEAGHTISPEIEKLCASCPVRVQCLRHAYEQEHRSGYFGGVSPGNRKQMTEEEAVLFITTGVHPKGRKLREAAELEALEAVDLESVDLVE